LIEEGRIPEAILQEVLAMQNLEKDLEFAIEKILCGTWKERKQMIDRVFTKDAKFWYILCLATASVVAGIRYVAKVDNRGSPAGISFTTHTDVTTCMEYTRCFPCSQQPKMQWAARVIVLFLQPLCSVCSSGHSPITLLFGSNS
jgi:hypothetical protein